MNSLDILYEDEDIIVCYKPAGIATQTKRIGQQDMESLLRNYRARKKEQPYIGIVHRLDQPVEGVMIFAKNPAAAADLSRQVRQRSIGKHYYAVVCVKEDCMLQPDQGQLIDVIVSDERKNISVISDKTDANAKEAKLDYRICGKLEDRKCIDILLHTGRHHQIRVQFAHAKAPLVGDTKYGDVPAKHLALCSYRIEFEHPKTKKKMDFAIEPKGEEFGAFLDKVGNLS